MPTASDYCSTPPRAFPAGLVEETGFACMAEALLKLNAAGARFAEVALHLRYDLKPTESKMAVSSNMRRLLVCWCAGAGAASTPLDLFIEPQQPPFVVLPELHHHAKFIGPRCDEGLGFAGLAAIQAGPAIVFSAAMSLVDDRSRHQGRTH